MFPVEDRLLEAERSETIELLLEEALVVGEVVAEQRERLHKRTPPEDDFRPSAGHGIEGGEALVDPDRVVGAEDRHR
jgi:hypothetical protein